MELLSLIPVIGFALGWMRWQNVTAGSALLHSVSTVVLVLFAGSLAGVLLPAALVLMFYGTTLIVIEVRRYANQRKDPPAPLVVFVVLCVVYWLVQSQSQLYFFDEYSHWGVFLREMLGNNQLWGTDSNSFHPRYLPGTPLWQYFFALFSNNVEGAAYLAQFSLLITPLIVLWEKTEWRRPGWIVGVFALVVITISNFGHGFTSLYVDHLLGAWFAGVLLNFIADFKNRSVWQLCSYLIPVSLIILLKTTGTFYAVSLAGILALLILIHPQFKRENHSLRVRLKYATIFPLAVVGIVTSILVTWNINRNSHSLDETGGSTSLVATRLVSQDSIYSSEQQAELTRRFVDVILHQQISKDEVSRKYNAFNYLLMPQFEKRFRLTTISLLGLSLVMLILLWRFEIPPDRKLIWAVAAGSVWLIAVAYIGVLYLGYRFVAADGNGLILSSFIRYAHSMLLPVVLFCFAPLLPAFAGNQQRQFKISGKFDVARSTLFFSLALAALYVFEPPYLKPLYTPQQAPEFRTQFDPLTSQLREKIGPTRLWVFYPDTAANSFAGQILQYQLSPGRVYVEHDAAVLLGDPGKLENELKNWEYLWYVTGSPELDIAFQRLLGETPTERVYRIVSADGGVRFEPVHDVFADDDR